MVSHTFEPTQPLGLKTHFPRLKPNIFNYRDYKSFVNDYFRSELLQEINSSDSDLILRILTGISQLGVAFLLFKLFISLLTSSTLKYLNENTFGCLRELFIRKILR